MKQRTRSKLGFKRFDSAARFCHAYDAVQHFLRVQTLSRRPAPFRWQRQLRHHQFTQQQDDAGRVTFPYVPSLRPRRRLVV